MHRRACMHAADDTPAACLVQELERNWAAHKSRSHGMFASAFKAEAACATVSIMAAAATAFRHTLEQEAQAHPRCNLLTLSRPYTFVRPYLVSAYGLAYRVAIHAQPTPLPPVNARTVLDVNVQVLHAAAAPGVHPEQKVSPVLHLLAAHTPLHHGDACCKLASMLHTTESLWPHLFMLNHAVATPCCQHLMSTNSASHRPTARS